jgi:hypothetical protein
MSIWTKKELLTTYTFPEPDFKTNQPYTILPGQYFTYPCSDPNYLMVFLGGSQKVPKELFKGE